MSKFTTNVIRIGLDFPGHLGFPFTNRKQWKIGLSKYRHHTFISLVWMTFT